VPDTDHGALEPRLPLHGLFSQLREAGLPLGVGEYMVFLRALLAGHGLQDRGSLRRLCQTLWATNEEEAALIARCIDEHGPGTESPTTTNSTAAGTVLPYTEARVPSERPEIAPRPDTVPPSDPHSTASSGESTTTPEAGQPVIEDAYQPAVRLELARATVTGISFPRPLPGSAVPFASWRELHTVTRRQMKQRWRYLRHMVRCGPSVELDVPATLRRLADEGMLRDAVLKPRRTNRASAIFLIDSGGSMVPFHGLSQQFLEAVRSGGGLASCKIYYFHDSPEAPAQEPGGKAPISIDTLLPQLTRDTAVLILGDSGAARRSTDITRVVRSLVFADRVRTRTRRVVWINPLPRERWPGTSAELVAAGVPMFELSHAGLEQAIDVLRGRPRRAPLPAGEPPRGSPGMVHDLSSLERCFGRPHVLLAYHAALPITLTPDLLYALWARFRTDIHGRELGIPWVAVADLLLSRLWMPVGLGTQDRVRHEMGTELRGEMLRAMQHDPRLGPQRVREVAEFCHQYADRTYQDESEEFRDMQSWSTLAFLQPDEVVRDLVERARSIDVDDRGSAAHLNKLIAALSPAPGLGLAEHISEPLVRYVRAKLAWARGKHDAAYLELKPWLAKGVVPVGPFTVDVPDAIARAYRRRVRAEEPRPSAESRETTTPQHPERNYHVLLIGIDNYQRHPLRGCVNDIDRIQQLLIQRLGIPGHQIRRLASPLPDALHETTVPEREATLSNIRAEFMALASDAVQPGDSVFIYYSGHGIRTKINASDNREFHREALVPVDFENADGSRTFLFDYELGELVGNIAARTRSCTLVFDCDSGTTALRRDDCQVVSACLPHERVKDVIIDGRHTGLFTHTLLRELEVRSNIDLSRLSWSTIWSEMCARVAENNPWQHPWMTGNPASPVFGGPTIDGDDALSIRREGDVYEVGAGTLAGIAPSALVAVYGEHPRRLPRPGSEEDRAARCGLLQVTSASRARAIAVSGGRAFALPPGARGRVIKPGKVARLYCRIMPPDKMIAATLSKSPFVELVESAAAEVGLTQVEGAWYLEDELHAPDPARALVTLRPHQLFLACEVLEHYYRYILPVRVARSACDLPRALELTLLGCPQELAPQDAQTTQLLDAFRSPDAFTVPGGLALREGTQICIQLTNRSQHRLRVTLLNSSARGEVHILGEHVLESRGSYRFWHANVLGKPFTLKLPAGVQFAADRLVAIGTTAMGMDLRHLVVKRGFSDILHVRDRDPADDTDPEMDENAVSASSAVSVGVEPARVRRDIVDDAPKGIGVGGDDDPEQPELWTSTLVNLPLCVVMSR
jgi:uncharacterized protein with von Willebrand factor type A (vWA) domain